MLQVKSCKVKQNSESIFRYFATAVYSNYKVQNVLEKIFMLSVIIQALKSRLCSSVHLLQIVVWHTVTGLLKLDSSSAGQDSPCADSPDGCYEN